MNQYRVFHANQCHEIIPSATNLTLSMQKMKIIFTSETPGTQNISSHLTTSAKQVSSMPLQQTMSEFYRHK